MRIAIITDIHEDVNSLKEAFRKIEKLKCDDIICIGDISDYRAPYYKYVKHRNAHECLRLIRENCSTIVLGNHDMHAAQIIPKHCSFFEFPENWYQLDYQHRHKIAKDILWFHEENDLNPLYKTTDIEFLRTLPEFVISKYSGINIFFSHYVYPNLSGLKKEFYTYSDEFKQHFEFIASHNCQLSFVGHSHTKGFFMATEKRFKQSGYKSAIIENEPTCIGIPPITGMQKKGGFCIFDIEDQKIRAVRI